MSSEAWLADINLPITENADAIAVDDSGIYVAYNRTIYRYDLNGQNQAHVANTSTAISDLITVGSFLVISENTFKTIVDQSTFSATDTISSYYLGGGLSSADNMLRIFGRSTGISPSDIGYMEIDNTGAIVSSGDSPHHGAYPGASKTWVFPDETRVVDNAGIIYSTQSLSYLGSFAGSCDGLTFVGDLPVLLRGEELIVYSNTLLESGTYTLASPDVDEVFSTDSAIFVFEEGYSVQKVLLSDFSTLEPGEPIDPTGLQYTPDAYVYDNDDNIVFLLSRIHANVFRWSIDNGRYLESIPLLGVPEYMSVDTESNILYLAYQSGKINKIVLNEPGLVEQHFTSLPQSPLGLANIEGFVFSADASGAWESHYTFAPDSTLISAVEWNHYSREYIWNEVNQKIYFFRDGTSPNDLLWEEINSTTGEIGTQQDSPYHSSAGILMPIRVAPDGSVVVLGSGRIYDALSLAQTNTLPNDILDAVWINDLLVTLKANTVSTNIQKWTSSYSPDGDFSVNGDPLRIFSVNGELLLIRSVAGVPTFDLLDLDNLPDDDGDGIYNISDNCPDLYNPNQEDADGDGIGDVCDSALQVTTPNGGNILEAGNNTSISWEEETGADHYTVKMSINGGASFWNLATNVTETSLTYLVDNLNTSNAIIRVVAYDAGNGWLGNDDSDASFSIVKYGTILSPNGGEVLAGGSPVLIDWAGHPDATLYKVRISINGGLNYWTLQDNIVGSQTTVVMPNLNSDQVLFRVIGYNGSRPWLVVDDTDSTLRLVKGGSLLTPDNGDVYQPGETLNITWAAHSQADHYVVRFSHNGGTSIWTLPGGGNVTENSFSWLLPNWLNSDQCKVKVWTINSSGQWIATGGMDGVFSVLKP
jgi:hypothetical protein